ncbi:MAG: lipoate--protein ligase [Anaerolineaceae bacterium]|nr:lipoate--protein ligase [Anaerolineaceae bacterium]
MIFVDNEKVTDPHINLAIEEYLLRNLNTQEDVLLFYINEPSIIIGRSQNTLAEINHAYVKEHGIHVVRRLSGGGAVYHDLGNLNFSFISNNEAGNFRNFQKFTAPVIHVLNEMGVPAELNGRNDILADGKKISGNAQYSTQKRMFSHGTLLFNSELSQVAAALNVKMNKIEAKGIKSVRSRVANISEHIAEPMDTLQFREKVLKGIFKDEPEITQYHLTEEDWQGIRKLVDERYGDWDWNFGRSPDFNILKSNRFAFGEVEAHIDVQRSKINAIKIYGDFLGQGEISDIEEALKGVQYKPEAMAEAIKDLDISSYFGGMRKEEFLDFLF